MKLGNTADIRIFKHKDISFRPKTYIFEDDSTSEIYIGSSNISASALEYGVEWNYRITQNESNEVFSQFHENFETLFSEHSLPLTDELLKEYSFGWKKSKFFKEIFNSPSKSKLFSSQFQAAETPEKYDSQGQIKPYGAQIEALYYLQQSRIEVSKDLVVMATGVGKTYLAAFDSRSFHKIYIFFIQVLK